MCVMALELLGKNDVVLETDQLFVMGDNRFHSFDSRNFGTVPVENIIGIVKVRLLPAPRALVFERPEY